ncbi:MAG: hypothetical protein AB1324_01905 [Candidatus Micrarchaeota archaeon]
MPDLLLEFADPRIQRAFIRYIRAHLPIPMRGQIKEDYSQTLLTFGDDELSICIKENTIILNSTSDNLMEIKQLYDSFKPLESEWTFYYPCRTFWQPLLTRKITLDSCTLYPSDESRYSSEKYPVPLVICFKLKAYDQAEAKLFGYLHVRKILPVISTIQNIYVEPSYAYLAGMRLIHPGFFSAESANSKHDSPELTETDMPALKETKELFSTYENLTSEKKSLIEKACRSFSLAQHFLDEYPTLSGAFLRSALDSLHGGDKKKTKEKLGTKEYYGLSRPLHDDLIPEYITQSLASHLETHFPYFPEQSRKDTEKYYNLLWHSFGVAYREIRATIGAREP